MYSNMKVVVLLVLVTIAQVTPYVHEEHEFSMDITSPMIRGGNIGIEEFDVHGRQLYSSTGGWSWSNMLCKYF